MVLKCRARSCAAGILFGIMRMRIGMSETGLVRMPRIAWVGGAVFALLFACGAALAQSVPHDNAWSDISACDDLEKIEQFLSWFPDSRHAQKARACRDWLQSKASDSQDDGILAPEQDSLANFGPKCGETEEGSECWRTLSHPPGCRVLDPEFRPDLKVLWSGSCPGEAVNGQGTLVVMGDGWAEQLTGEARNGRLQGRWIWQRSSGVLGQGEMADSRKQGVWTLRHLSGLEQEGLYVENHRHGRWTSRTTDGAVTDGIYLTGMPHGRWEVTTPGGTTAIRFFKDGIEVPEADAPEGWEPEVGDPRRFAEVALGFRTAAAVGSESALAALEEIHGTEPPVTELLWRPFFPNTIVKLGRVHSRQPIAMYYNPLLDVAVLISWQKADSSFLIASIKSLPGTQLADPLAEAGAVPDWLASGGSGEALIESAAERLQSFSAMHPPDSFQGTGAMEASDPKGLGAVLQRLARNAAARVRWETGEDPWLAATLERIEQALSAGSVDTILAAAPGTDPETAQALSELPAAFADSLMLDLIVEGGDADRLVFGSLPDDGDVYVVAACEIEGRACPLGWIHLLSLSEKSD